MASEAETAKPRIGAYAWYALFVLVIVYIVNFIDRQIISILASDIHNDLGATHAHLSLSHTNEHAVAQVIFERRQ